MAQTSKNEYDQYDPNAEDDQNNSALADALDSGSAASGDPFPDNGTEIASAPDTGSSLPDTQYSDGVKNPAPIQDAPAAETTQPPPGSMYTPTDRFGMPYINSYTGQTYSVPNDGSFKYGDRPPQSFFADPNAIGATPTDQTSELANLLSNAGGQRGAAPVGQTGTGDASQISTSGINGIPGNLSGTDSATTATTPLPTVPTMAENAQAGMNQPVTNAMSDALLKILGTNPYQVDTNDPTMTAQNDAYRRAQERGIRSQRAALAERMAAGGTTGGGMDTFLNGAYQNAGENEANYAAGLSQTRQNQQLDQYRTALADALGQGQLGYNYASLGQNDQHFYDNLSYLLAMLTMNANKNTVDSVG